MNKTDIIKHYLELCKKFEEKELMDIPPRAILMRMSSHFLDKMYRPWVKGVGVVKPKDLEDAVKKAKRPPKYLKWFNSEERYLFVFQSMKNTNSIFSSRAFDALVVSEWDDGWGEHNNISIIDLHPDYPNCFIQQAAESFFHHCLKKFERSRRDSRVAMVVDDSEVTDAEEDNDDDEELQKKDFQ